MVTNSSPSHGIVPASGAAITTEGIAWSGSALAVTGLSVDTVGDDGGWAIVASGVFPPDETFTVTVGGVEAFGGVPGSGATIETEDGSSISFIAPPLPVGAHDVVIECSDGSSATVTDGLTVIPRTFTDRLYSLRAAFPPPRDVGPYDIAEEAPAGAPTGLWWGLTTAIADTLLELSGVLLVRTTAIFDGEDGDTSIQVEGLHRWPDVGEFVIAGVEARYASKTDDTLVDVTDRNGDPLTVVAPVGEIVAYLGSESGTGFIEQVKNGWFLDYAQGADLDTFGRNIGLKRPFGLHYDDYRELLKVWSYLDAGTIYAIELVLEVLVPGAWEVYEVPSDPCRVFVVIDAVGTDSYEGKFFLPCQEVLSSTGATITPTEQPVAVAGIWDETDVDRTGTNYAMSTVPVRRMSGTSILETAGAFWVVSDLGKSVELTSGEVWRIRAYLDPQHVQVGSETSTDGRVNAGAPGTFQVDAPVFEDWMVGHRVRIIGGLQPGDYEILSIDSETTVTLDAASWFTETWVSWAIVASFDGSTDAAAVHRAEIVGADIVAPDTLPASVLVDYATIPSGQLVASGSRAADAGAHPGYLWDQTTIVQDVLDQITVSGVEAVVEVA